MLLQELRVCDVYTRTSEILQKHEPDSCRKFLQYTVTLQADAIVLFDKANLWVIPAGVYLLKVKGECDFS